MVIYIDVLIFTNILINYCILSATKKFLHIKTKEIQVILGAVFGGICALTLFIDTNSNVLSLLIKLVVSVLMCLISFKFVDIKTFIKYVSSVFTFSVIFCGVMILIYQIIRPTNMAIINDTVYFQVEPLVLITVSVVIYIVLVILQRVLKTDVINTLVNLNICICGNEYSCIGKIDTGSSVIEPFSGAPVIITEKDILNDLTPQKVRIVPYNALGNSGIMYAVKADKIVIDKKEIQKEIYIGMYSGEIDKQVKAIINSQIIR